MVYANALLYVVNGAKKTSTILCFQPPGTGQPPYPSSSSAISTSDAEQEGAFRDQHRPSLRVLLSRALCYVSNQDTNVVAQASVSPDFQTATIEPGCQSHYLNNQTSYCPSSGCVYLDGTFVASQNGTLPDVTVAATDVPAKNGGLAVHISNGDEGSPAAAAAAKGKPKVQNSVRDLAIAGDVLLVCDEPKRDPALLVDRRDLPGLQSDAARKPHPPGDPRRWTLCQRGRSALLELPERCGGPHRTHFHECRDCPLGLQGGRHRHRRGVEHGLRGLPERHRNDRQRPDQCLRTGPPDTPGPAPVLGAGTTFATLSEDTPEFLLFLPDR